MTDTPDLDLREAPALSNDELRETIDLMATAVASMSNRIDGLTKVANKQFEVSTEARIAAFAARDQTNPKNYGELLGKTLDTRLGKSADTLIEIVAHLGLQTDKTIAALANSQDDTSRAYREVFEREQKAERLRQRLPWFGLGALVFALAMTVTLPHFLASTPSTCAVLGATWTTTTEGTNACVFYQP